MPIRRSPSSDSPREAVFWLPAVRLLLRPSVVWTPTAPGVGDPIGSQSDAIKRSELRRVGGMTGADIDGGDGGVGSRADAIEHIEFQRVGGMTGALSSAEFRRVGGMPGALSGADVDGSSGTAAPDVSAAS